MRRACILARCDKIYQLHSAGLNAYDATPWLDETGCPHPHLGGKYTRLNKTDRLLPKYPSSAQEELLSHKSK